MKRFEFVLCAIGGGALLFGCGAEQDVLDAQETFSDPRTVERRDGKSSFYATENEIGDRCSSVDDQAAETRWVEVGVAMDNALYRQLSDLAEAEAVAAEILKEADLLYQNADCGLPQPAVRLRLVQLEIFTEEDPWEMPADDSGPALSALRDTFGEWAKVNFADNDVWHLLTGLYFVAPGVANPWSVCTENAASVSRPVVRLSEPDWISLQARVVAHEIGHTLGLNHDGKEASACSYVDCEASYELFVDTTDCDSRGFVMSEVLDIDDPEVEFSECSQYQLHILTTLGRPYPSGSYEGVASCLLE